MLTGDGGRYGFKYRSTIEQMNEQAQPQADQMPSNSKLFLFGSSILLIIHYFIAFFLTPTKILSSAGLDEMTQLGVKLGYGLCILATISLPIPLLVSILSLLFKSNRNIGSLSKIFFWCLVFTLIINIVFSYFLAPIVLKSIEF